ncbi:MAG: type II toxin-antitoxin system VapC family toxin [Nocardioidaceae bacterium]
MSIAVVDAATVVDLICGFPAAEPFREVLTAADAVAAPAHLDAEVLSALGRLKRAGHVTRAVERVEALAAFGATRWPLRPLLSPAWALVDRIATRDALYVALATSLDGFLVTTDVRLRRGAAGIVAIADPDAPESAP